MAYFDENEFLKDLETLVNIDSGSHDIEGLNRVAAFLKEKYEKAGLQTEATGEGAEGRPFLSAFSGNGAREKDEKIDLLLIGHIDTVFPRGTAEKRPFRIEGRRAFGPGVADMKSGVLLAFYLTRALMERYPHMKICIANNSDEEIGTGDCQLRLEELAARSRFCMDMEPGRLGGNFVARRKGAADYRIQFHGAAAHAGNEPEKGASAIREMACWITQSARIHGMEDGITVNVGLVRGGTASNVVPDSAEATVDVRYFTMEQLEKVDQAFRRLAETPSIPGVRISVERLNQSPPMGVNGDSRRWMEILTEEAKKLGQEIQFLSVGGSSDANLISLTGIPVLDGCGPVGDGYHSEKEYILLDTAEQRFTLLLQTVSRMMEAGYGEN